MNKKKMDKYYIGIDNGVNGGIVVIDNDNTIVFKSPMPVYGKSKKDYDLNTLKDILVSYKGASVILEKAQPQFRDGKKQAFKTGFGYGAIQGLLSALSMSFEIVAPKTWQKNIFNGLNTDDTKVASILFCKRKWPSIDWTPTERSGKQHDGMTDAACMALYGKLRDD